MEKSNPDPSEARIATQMEVPRANQPSPSTPPSQAAAAVPVLSEAHTKLLLDRYGLSEQTVRGAGLRTITREHAAQVLSRSASSLPSGGIEIPYPSGRGLIRWDQPRVVENGRICKYDNPLGHDLGIYNPNLKQALVEEPALPLYVTEGPLKTLALLQCGLAAVGISGVYGMHDVEVRRDRKSSEEDGWVLRPDLARLVMQGRQIALVWDSDIDTNENVLMAAIRAVQMVRKAGGSASISYIGCGDSPDKLDVSDLYVAFGRDSARLKKTIEEVTRPTEPTALLTWIQSRLANWNPQEREVELLRAFKLMVRLLRLGEAAFEFWSDSVASTLGIKKKVVNGLIEQARPAEVFEADDGWHSPPGYVVNESRGVLRVRSGQPTSVANGPINITEYAVDDADRIHLTVAFTYAGQKKSVTMPREKVYGRDLIDIASKGAPVTQNNVKLVQEFLQDQEKDALLKKKLPKVRLTTQFGWSRNLDMFSLGRDVIGFPNARCIGSADDRFLDAIAIRGHRDTYLDLCRQVRAESSVAELMWAAGYAAPLVRLLGLRSLVVSLWGTSGSGKSAQQSLAVSPYGRPEGIKIGGDVSPAGLEGVLLRSRDQTLHMDDTQLTKSREILDALSYMIANGTTRTRATQHGDLRESKTWLTCATVSGEKPLLQLGAAAGAKNRTLEVRASGFKDQRLPAHIHQELDRTHGHTIREYIEGLVKNFVVGNNLDKLQNLHRQHVLGLAQKQDEMAMHVALLVTADVLARTLVFAEDTAEAVDAALTAGRAVLVDARKASEALPSTVDDAYEQIKSWVSENENHFWMTKGKDSRDPRFGTFILGEGKKQIVAILPTQFRDFAKKQGFDVQQVLSELADRGLVIKGDAGRLDKKTGQLGTDRPRAYWIVLDDGQEAASVDGGSVDAAARAAGPSVPSNREWSAMTHVESMEKYLELDFLRGTRGTGGTGGTGEEEKKNSRGISSSSPTQGAPQGLSQAASQAQPTEALPQDPAEPPMTPERFLAEFENGNQSDTP